MDIAVLLTVTDFGGWTSVSPQGLRITIANPG